MSINKTAEDIVNEFNEKVEVLRQELVEELKSVAAKKWEPEGGDWWIDSRGCVKEAKSSTETRNFGVERKTE